MYGGRGVRYKNPDCVTVSFSINRVEVRWGGSTRAARAASPLDDPYAGKSHLELALATLLEGLRP